jgi:hypothetical protein
MVGSFPLVHAKHALIILIEQPVVVSKLLQSAIDLLRSIKSHATNFTKAALARTTRQEMAAICPSCFAPASSRETEETADLPSPPLPIIIAVDGNFSQNRSLFASIHDYPQPQPSTFLPQRYFDEARAKVESALGQGVPIKDIAKVIAPSPHIRMAQY